MGDGESGLATAILVAIIAMVIGGVVLFFFLGRLTAGLLKLGPATRVWASFAGAAVGLVISGVLVTATFFESSWSPPPTLSLRAPAGYAHRWVILLEDPASARRLEWRGMQAPFLGRTAEVEVGRSGVVRVRSLDRVAGRGDTRTLWSDGATASGFAGGPAPAALHATSFVAFLRGDAGDQRGDDLPAAGSAAFTDYVRARERGP